jgi:CHASE2 domain-containing sensor protein
LVVAAVPDGGGLGGKLAQLLIGLLVIGIALSALEAALYHLMPYIVVAAALVGAGWLVWRIASRRNRW